MLNVDKIVVDIQGSRILNAVSLQIQPGELVCLVGRNGAGKTTTFRSIMGYQNLTSGEITFNGKSLRGFGTWKIAQFGIGFSPEESEVYADLSVAENIELPTWTREHGRPPAERIANAYAVFPKLKGYAHRGGAQLSGGERKMVSIARALALDPDLLLLDEPFEGLSPAVIPLVASGVSSIRDSGKAVLMAESNIHHIPDYANSIFVLERGEIIFQGTLATAKKDPQVLRVIAGEADRSPTTKLA